MVVAIEQYASTSSYRQKVQKRTYASGRVCWYTMEGKRWYPVQAYVVEGWLKDGYIMKDTGKEDWIKNFLKEATTTD